MLVVIMADNDRTNKHSSRLDLVSNNPYLVLLLKVVMV
jgi:hypothetical protein